MPAQTFHSQLLLDGLDSVLNCDIDTTGHWWAFTKPTSNRYRLIVDGIESELGEDISYPVLANYTGNWAYFIENSGEVELVQSRNDSIIKTLLPATTFGEIVFSPNGEHFAYTYWQNNIEVIQLENRRLEVTERADKLFIDNGGYSFTIIGKHGDSYVVNTDGIESTTYDSVSPIGYWHTGDFIYAAYNGANWELYKGNKQMGESYMSIIDYKINNSGTVMAVLVRQNTGRCMCIAFSDDYYEPLYGRTYASTWGLALHPTEMLYGYVASENYRTYVVQNSTEYYSAGEVYAPLYTYDGDELYFHAMGEFSSFINVNGQKTDVRITLYSNDILAKKPGNNTFALSTDITLLVYDFVKQQSYTDNIYGAMSKAIYNPHTGQYEAIGIINNRLYLVTCRI